MNILSWNCQGLGNPLTVRALQNWCWRDRPNIVFIMETMISNKDLEKVRDNAVSVLVFVVVATEIQEVLVFGGKT